MTIYHKHHIIPKHAGGTDDPENLVELTVADHAEAHRKLYEEHGRWQDRIAWHGLSGIIGNEEVISQASSERMKGVPKSKEHVAKMSASMKNRKPDTECPHCHRVFHKWHFVQYHGDRCKQSPDYDPAKDTKRNQMSKTHKNKIVSQETKRKLSESYRPAAKKLCVHCNWYGDPGNYAKCHGDNCKAKASNTLVPVRT